MKLVLHAALLFLCVHSLPLLSEAEPEKSQRLNFFISTRTKGIDPAMKSAQWQARLQSALHKNFYCLVVEDADQMAEKMIRILEKRKARIGCIWFDSHGNFSRRYSSFEVGKTEFSYQSVRSAETRNVLLKLAPYMDTFSIAGIGSCYGGASFEIPAIDAFPAQEMNGDSLLMELGRIWNGATIYGSESFVMCRPGMFGKGYALAGRPGRRKFSDPVHRPVWERLGQWNCFEGRSGRLFRVPTVYLDKSGQIGHKEKAYLAMETKRRGVARKLGRLRKGNYDLAYFYQHLPYKEAGE